ncbi:MAG: CehA/McbA family metallohydrolase [Armatimonadota bacterium]|jgi:hypothetical protein
MDFANPFTAPGNWYKGNLHTHTTVSDGSYTPEKAVREYHDAGYHFLALTDHSKVAVTENPWPDEFLLLLGTEFDGDTSDVGESYHILGFGLTRPGEPLQEMTVPRALAWIAERGGEAVFAHPYWSGLVISDLLKWQHAALGIEVFNTTCHASIGKGCSAVHWDDLLGRGKRVWGFAVDDCHGRRDCTTAWVMARAPSLTRDAIMNSLRAGLFYSSYGPSIEDVSIDGDMVSVKTSPVVEINFIAQRWSGGHFLAPAGEQFTEASYKLRGHEMYIRVECRDAQGRWAWANPIYSTF